jgi:glycosyltransferase involved in cell wall biosynthesis
MASGTTVVSTAEGGHGEFLRDQVNSLIFMPGSAEDLAQKLEMVLDRPGLSASLAQAALAQVSMQFCVLSYARRLAAWLERIRAGQRPANLASDSAAPKRLRAATLSFDISVEPVDWKKV